jgi:iron complex outermembrane receptor protein
VLDTDPNGRRRAVFGPNSGAIDNTQQTTVKVRGGYDAEGWSADAFVGGWRNESQNRNETWLRDMNGNAVWTGKVSANGVVFNVPSSAFSAFDRVEDHMQAGLTLRTTRATGWNGSVVASTYRILGDAQTTASVPDNVALQGTGAGTLGLRDGTRWNTFEAQATWTPEAGGIPHKLAFGYHRNGYRLANPTYNLANWADAGVRGTLAQDVGGRTQVQAVYVQDVWQLSEAFTLTSGLRYERWRAFDGRQFFTGLAPLAYRQREVNGTSPKLSLAWTLDAQSQLRLSAGRGVRFPTVPELFQGSKLASSIQVADPNLKPETSDALELAYNRQFARADLRVSVFEDDIRDSIFSQTNARLKSIWIKRTI